MKNEKQFALIKSLAETNDLDYSLLKTAEECTELSEIVLKKVLKKGGDKEPGIEFIVEELGDVLIRCAILTEALNVSDLVNARVDYKLEKYKKYLEDNKYKGRI